ncbi:MAG TPA: LuxR C-terminal-related transcriptional regulator [Rubrobacter sp.]|nr:LuxR C-terminal-related transcriptional regulator [Rubrobacter sp.]
MVRDVQRSGSHASAESEAVPGVEARYRPPGDLPVELSSLVGREREISAVKNLLHDHRLLTLVGPGGQGKTRLALAAASGLSEDFEDGVWWVGLASLSDPDLVPQVVAQALQVREQPGIPLTEVLVRSLLEERLLLVLDNCEHLAGACARFARTMLSSCPGVRILATSREVLGADGEMNWRVPPLPVPNESGLSSVEEMGGHAAVALFVERARARLPGFTLTGENALAVAEVCRKLDGLPLAIELAAARVPMLSLGEISERLEKPLKFLGGASRRGEARHRTLRATLDWSHEMLSQEERSLFRRLSLFAGGFDLEAAESVGAGDGIEPEMVLDPLSGLVDKSLVVAEDGGEVLRYRMLEPVRQYALEHLEESGEATTARDRHASLFMALAERSHPEMRGPGQVGWILRLGRENDNLRGAMSWALSSGDSVTAARLGSALWPFWWYRGQHREGRNLMEAALEGELEPPLRIRATVAAAIMTYGQADNDGVMRYMDTLQGLSRQAGGDAYADGYAHAGLGLVAMNLGDFDEARAQLQEALPLLVESGEVWTASQAHTWIGTVALLEGDNERAMTRFEEGMALAREIGDRTGMYNALYALASMSLAGGDYPAAKGRFEEAMALSEEMGDRANAAYCLEGLAAVAASQEHPERAARLFGAAEKLLESIGVPVWTSYKPDRAFYEQTIENVRSGLGPDAFEDARQMGRAMTPEHAIAYALEEERARPSPPAGLSEREAEVLALAAEGLTNAQIAQRLYISPRTVNRHMGSVYKKLGLGSRAAAARFASEHGLV